MRTQIKIVPLLHSGDKGWDDAVARWMLTEDDKEVGRYETIFEARIAGEQFYRITRWKHDPNTSAYIAVE